jgi:hypothetical protein
VTLSILQVYLVTLITYLFVPESRKAIDSSLVAGITVYGVYFFKKNSHALFIGSSLVAGIPIQGCFFILF